MVSSKRALVSLRFARAAEIPEISVFRVLSIEAERFDPDERPHPDHQRATARERLRTSCCKVMGMAQDVWMSGTYALSLLRGTASIAPEPGNAVSAGGTGTRNRW